MNNRSLKYRIKIICSLEADFCSIYIIFDDRQQEIIVWHLMVYIIYFLSYHRLHWLMHIYVISRLHIFEMGLLFHIKLGYPIHTCKTNRKIGLVLSSFLSEKFNDCVFAYEYRTFHLDMYNCWYYQQQNPFLGSEDSWRVYECFDSHVTVALRFHIPNCLHFCQI